MLVSNYAAKYLNFQIKSEPNKNFIESIHQLELSSFNSRRPLSKICLQITDF